ncbi:homoserine dehydrogenase [Kroppenstedtia sanguinis]|uniref:Homoserine dehydrogenase n=1 Tax=Kroppenstedtia sanguinis TaxID=1380684 RepID=A0ABW4CD36_9BACL
MKRIGVGLLGFGTVGGGVYKTLRSQEDVILKRTETLFEVRSILVKEKEKERSIEGVQPLITTDFDRVLESGVEVIVEAIGGTEPARMYVERALEAGCHVVTANKELMAKHGVQLERLARHHQVQILYEASVGGGIPVLGTMGHFLKANRVQRITGILNGTTNYILTRMAREGASFEEVLAEAQQKGYAEADPAADVDGFDAVYKLAILCRLAFETQVSVQQILREGIRDITPEELELAQRLGYVVKLLATGEQYGEKGPVSLGVSPSLLPISHPLAGVEGVYNAIHLEGDVVGDVTLVGRGAGERPTASAVVEDLSNLFRLPSPKLPLSDSMLLPAGEAGGSRFLFMKLREGEVPEPEKLRQKLERIGLEVVDVVSARGGVAFILRRWDPSYTSVVVTELGLELSQIVSRPVQGGGLCQEQQPEMEGVV